MMANVIDKGDEEELLSEETGAEVDNMKETPPPWAIALGVFVLLGLFFAFWLIFLRKPAEVVLPVPEGPTRIVSPTPSPTGKKPQVTPVSAPMPVMTMPSEPPEILQTMAKEVEARKKEIEKRGLERLEKIVNDPNTSTQTREVYRLRMNPELKKAHLALQGGDKATAMSMFGDIVKDPKSSPVTKYLCLDYMVDIARQTKNPELFFTLWKMQASLVRDEDLSVMSIDQGDAQLSYAEEMERFYRMSKDPVEYNNFIASWTKGDPSKTEEAKEIIRENLKHIEQWFTRK